MNNTGKKKKTMSNYNWCHGPECHTKQTQDRIRGVKGKKVLRTRKIKVKGSDWYGATSSWNWFCSHNCQQDFWNMYGPQIRAIAPRNEPLETAVDVTKEEREGWRGTYTETIITAQV
jgi:hypothetical protein